MRRKEGFDWEAAKARLERARLGIESPARDGEQLDALYRKRARALSRPETVAVEEGERILVFRLGAARYAFPLASVSEVITRARITPAPGAPAEVAGLIQVRGEIRAVWHAAILIGLPKSEAGSSGNVLLLRLAGGEAGFLVDEAEDILAIRNEDRRPAPEKAPHAAWMTNDLVVVLDPATMLPGRMERNGQE